jgi:succinyl-CoA synthetase beta subunit
MAKDIILLEINPLTEAADGKVYCKLISLLKRIFNSY